MRRAVDRSSTVVWQRAVVEAGHSSMVRPFTARTGRLESLRRKSARRPRAGGAGRRPRTRMRPAPGVVPSGFPGLRRRRSCQGDSARTRLVQATVAPHRGGPVARQFPRAFHLLISLVNQFRSELARRYLRLVPHEGPLHESSSPRRES
jgi:hypothetical protein